MGAVSNAISGAGAAADKKSKSKAVTQSSRAGLQVSSLAPCSAWYAPTVTDRLVMSVGASGPLLMANSW